jgi:hypothetical protein
MIADSEGGQYDDEYSFQVAHMSGQDSGISSYDPFNNGDTGNPFFTGGSENDTYIDLEHQKEIARTLGDQIPFILHPGQDILEREPGTQPTLHNDPAMQLMQPSSQKALGSDKQDISLKLPTPANDNKNLQIPEDPYTRGVIDQQWNQMIKKNNVPTLQIIPGGKTSDQGNTQVASNDATVLPTINVTAGDDFNKEVFAKKYPGPLADNLDLVQSTAKARGLTPEETKMFLAITAQETGGNSRVLRENNNPAGVMHGKIPVHYNSLEEGIRHAMDNFKYQLDKVGGSLEKLKQVYAPDKASNDPKGLNKNWLPGVQKIMKTLGFD